MDLFPVFIVILCSIQLVVSARNFKFLQEKLWKSDGQEEGGLSAECSSQMLRILLDPVSALKMFDSSTKIPEGVLNGRFYHLGDYDECVNIKSDQEAGTIYGKYCLGTIPVPPSLLPKSNEGQPSYKELALPKQSRALASDIEDAGLHISVCVPNKCSPEEVVNFFGFNFTVFNHDYCYSKDEVPVMIWGPIVAVSFFGVILGIAIFSSIYDIYLYYHLKKPAHQLLVAFSVVSNTRKLFTSSKDPDQLLCLNGIRAISMMWVIMGHQYANFIVDAPVTNFLELQSFQREPANMFVLGATISVDSFFVVAGIVTVYTFLKSCDKGVSFNIPMYYLHRYLRLTPAFAVVILFYTTLLNYVSDGPLWVTVDKILVEPCRSYWWSALLYIQNYIVQENLDVCVTQSWYLSVDMQLFLLSPLVLWPLKKWPKPTLYGMGLLIASGVVIPFVLTWEFSLLGINGIGTLKQLHNFNYLYYTQTYARFAPYVIGMMNGYLIYKIKRSEITLPLDKYRAAALWVTSIAGLLACLFGGNALITSEYSKLPNAFYMAFNRPAWAVCLSFVIVACISGYGGPIDKFLSLPIFQFLTKVSYSMYLVHYVLIVSTLASLRTEIQFSHFLAMYIYWGTFMFTLGLGLLLCLLFESPIIVIEKVIFGNNLRQSKKEDSNAQV